MTASIGSLAVWLKAYLVFITPQALALFVYFYLHDSIFVALAIMIFYIFVVKVAINFNAKFKHEYELMSKNIELISEMETEIYTRKEAQI